MHAVIKIVSFLVFGTAVALGNEFSLLAGMLLLVPLYSSASHHLGHAMKLLQRLRWLLLSIMLVYVFFTPGQLLWTALSWGPTLEGLTQGGLRIAALVLLVFAVNWVLGSTEQDAFLSAILWCLQPLAVLGFPHQRLAVRISLTLEAVRGIRTNINNSAVNGYSEGGSRLSAITKRSQQLVNSVIEHAATTSLREIPIPQQSRPPLLQWAIPVLLITLFLALKRYSDILGDFFN